MTSQRNVKSSLSTAFIALALVAALVGGFLIIGQGGGIVPETGGDSSSVEAAFLAQFRNAEALESGETLPDVSFTDPEGKETGFSVFRGKYLVLNIWAAWCPPCLVEMPSLQKLRDRFRGSDLEVIAVSADTAYTPESVRALGKRYGFGDVAMYHDRGARFQDAFSLYALPVSFIVDPKGRILYRLEGDVDWTSAQTLAFLEEFSGVKRPDSEGFP